MHMAIWVCDRCGVQWYHGESQYLTAAFAGQMLGDAPQAFSQLQAGHCWKLKEENLLFLCAPLIILPRRLWV